MSVPYGLGSGYPSPERGIVDPEKQGWTIGQLYNLKETYRIQGENVCWIAKDLLASLKQYVVLKGTSAEEKMKKLEDSINLFEGR